MAEDRKHIDRLREEQLNAIEDTNQRINKLEGFAADYKILQDRLTTLPDKVGHDIMVPFGKFAFMPGQIVHTNEVLVLLGDNWFSDQSAKQAVDIAGRRIKALEEQIRELQKQRGLLEPRLAFTSELDTALQEQQNIVEIKEEYDEEKEVKWKERHRERVRQYKQSLRSNIKAEAREDPQISPKPDTMNTSGDEGVITDSELWRRLDELELQERQNREMLRDFESPKHRKDKISSSGSLPKSVVRWKDQQEASDDDDDDDDDDSYYDSEESDADEITPQEEEEREGNVIRPSSIQFSHTKMSTFKDVDGAAQDTTTPVDCSREEKDGSVGTTLVSPADVYDAFIKPVLEKPKSILKPSKTPSASKKESSEKKSTRSRMSKPSHVIETLSNQVEAFSGTVKEKPKTIVSERLSGDIGTDTIPMAASTASAAAGSHQTNQPTKRVSRFKAQRMKNDA